MSESGPYILEVYHPGNPRPVERLEVGGAVETLAKIKALLAEHPECERLVVKVGLTRLFAVDCKGNRIP